MLRSLLLLALACAGPAFAQTETAPAAEPSSSGRAIVDAGNQQFQRAFAARDAQTLAGLYSEDGRVIPPGQVPAAGRDAIAIFWAGTMQQIQRVELDTQAVELDGDLILEDGVARLTGSDGSVSEIQYLVAWKRNGGHWYLHRDIWNDAGLSEPPTGAEATPAVPRVDENPDEALEVPDAPDAPQAGGLLQRDDVP
jgi:uncharacterized protein (TIGR02246 family)